MTLHSRVKHKCSYCETSFVPLPEAPCCPKCNQESDMVFPDFVNDTLESAWYNLTHYGMWVKMWSTLNIGDWYYYQAFSFLDYACKKLKADKYHFMSQTLPKDKADKLATQFLGKKNLFVDSQHYWKHGLQTYLSLLLQRQFKHSRANNPLSPPPPQ